MPIRFKTEEFCGLVAGESISTCHDIQVPIRDWDLSPNPVAITYEGQYPQNRLITITYPELWELVDYEDVDSFRFAIEVVYGNTEYFDLISAQDINNIQLNQDGQAQFELRFKNLAQLPPGITNVEIKHKAYGTRAELEAILETRTQTVQITNKSQSSPRFDKETYEIIYNRTADTFIGDTLINLENLTQPLNLILHDSSGTVGFFLDPASTNSLSTIQRKPDIATIYDTNGVHHYGLALEAPTGGWYDIANIKVTVVGISTKVSTNIFKDANFCLDSNAIDLEKSKPEVDRVRMNLELVFQKAGSEPEAVFETYEYLFLTDRLKMFPGEEIQDFFHRMTALNLSEDSVVPSFVFNVVRPTELFAICKAQISLEEYDSEWNLVEEHDLGITHWVPGKRPKAYPYLTNSRLRRTYTNSMISVSAIREDFITHELNKIASPNVNLSSIPREKWIVNNKFSRSSANHNYGALEIIKHKTLSLEPGVDDDGVINCIFENQNYCPDWFTFTGHHERQTELDHILTQNLSSGAKFKADVEKNKTLVLNTGWIWREELELLEELMESSLCYVQLSKDLVAKCFPISKKPLKYDSERMLHQMLVEFEVIDYQSTTIPSKNAR